MTMFLNCLAQLSHLKQIEIFRTQMIYTDKVKNVGDEKT